MRRGRLVAVTVLPLPANTTLAAPILAADGAPILTPNRASRAADATAKYTPAPLITHLAAPPSFPRPPPTSSSQNQATSPTLTSQPEVPPSSLTATPKAP